MSTETGVRRGRPRAADSPAHREAVLAAARTVILEQGYAHTTMLDVARAAGASKETLYRWFGTKAGLMAALVEVEGEATLRGVRAALARPAEEPTVVLTDFAERLLALLTGPWSVAANRAGMLDPEVAQAVLARGRHTVGPVVERYLAEEHGRGRLAAPDSAAAFGLLYGLVVQDTQIRVLLGEPAPTPAQVRARAVDAVATFVRLHPSGR